MTVFRSVLTFSPSRRRYFVLRNDAVAWLVSMRMVWRRRVRSSHRYATASPMAASAAAAVSVILKVVGSLGSRPPMNSTSFKRSADQPA